MLKVPAAQAADHSKIAGAISPELFAKNLWDPFLSLSWGLTDSSQETRGPGGRGDSSTPRASPSASLMMATSQWPRQQEQ